MKHVVGHVLGVAGRKPDTQIGVDCSDAFKQLGKTHHRLTLVFDVTFIVDVPFVAVDVLAEQRHFAVARIKQLMGFSYNALRVSAALAASGERNHTETAHVVAAPHNADERRNAIRIQPHRADFRVGLLSTQQHVDRLLPAVNLINEVGNVAVRIRADHQIHEFLLFEQRLFQPFRHASEYTHHQFRPVLLRFFELAQTGAHALLGVLADGTGIQEDQIRLFFIPRGRESRFVEDACHNLRIAEVHLAAIALQIELASIRRRA